MRFSRQGPVAVIAVSEDGARLAARIASALPDATVWTSKGDLVEGARAYGDSLPEHFGRLWTDHSAIVAVMASGIAVRAAAQHVASKLSDPAIVVVDDAGRFAIALLSGHEGGANTLAEDIAELTGAVPVVTTGSDARRGVVLGVGSRRGVSLEQVLVAIDEALAGAGRSRSDVRALATIDMKADEPALREAARELGVPLRIVPRERIRTLQDVLREKTFAEDVTGVASVCVPSALLTDPHALLLTPPIASSGVTVAVAEDDCSSSASAPADAST